MIRAETVLLPGQSGYVPRSGTNPQLPDQIPLYRSFPFKPAVVDPPGTTETPFAGVTITRDAHGVPNIPCFQRSRTMEGRRLRDRAGPARPAELFRRTTEGRLAEVLARSRLAGDIVSRRDYYTRGELRRMLNRLPAVARASKRTRTE